MVLDRLPWFEAGKGQKACLARTDVGLGCELQAHDVRISHAHQQGEITVRWSVLVWTDRTIDHDPR